MLAAKVAPKRAPILHADSAPQPDADDDLIIDRCRGTKQPSHSPHHTHRSVLRQGLIRYVGGAVLWCVAMSVAQRFDLGPVAFLLTIIALVLLNLGTRRPGEASAYSVFNNFVRLPGQLTADAIDEQIRAGQM